MDTEAVPTPWKPSVGAAPSSGVSVGARPQLVDSLRIALIGCLVAGVVLALFEVALLLDVDDVLWLVLAFPVIACGYFAAGVRAWWLRPGSMMGPLIMLGGFTLVMAGLGNTGVGTLSLAGALSATWILAVVVHLVLAFPSGRLRFQALRIVVVAAYVNSVVLQVPQVLLGSGPAQVAAWAQHGLGTVVMASTAVALAVKLRAASPAQRRTLVPLYGYGMGVAGLIPLSSIVFRGLLDVSPIHVATVQLVAIAGVPVAFVLAALRGSFARTAEAEALATWLGSGPVRPPLAEALARALGDPSVVLAYWLPERSEFVDVSGQVVEVPSPGSTPRDAVPVEVGGLLVGAVVFWFPFSDNPWLHTWQVAPTQPAGSRAVDTPYNYPFADYVPDGLQRLITALVDGAPSLTPSVGRTAASVTANGLDGKNMWGVSGTYPVSRDIWGASKNSLLYIQDTTLRVTANG